MSLKATSLGEAIKVPKTTSRFLVHIPGILDSPIRVFATQLPQKSVSVVPLVVAGQTINLPGKNQFTGRWGCSVYESELLEADIQIELLKKIQYVPGHLKLIEPIIFLTDERSGAIPIKMVKLKGAFLQTIDEVQLDWSKPANPLAWKLNFQYSYLFEENFLHTPNLL